MIPSESAIPRIERFLKLLEEWNGTHALTSLSLSDRYEELILDSLPLLPQLESLPAGSMVVDFGSGMGIPAFVIAWHRPDLKVLALDASQKKIAFIQQVKFETQTDNLTALHGRAELIEPLHADGGIAKAVGSPELLWGWWNRHGKKGATFHALKSVHWQKEPYPNLPQFEWKALEYELPTRGSRIILSFQANGQSDFSKNPKRS